MKSSVAMTAVALLMSSVPAAFAAGTESQRINEFFEQVFERSLLRSPLRQTRLGLKSA